MTVPRSRLIEGLKLPQDTQPDVGVVRANGEPDDAIRILVLLGAHLATRLGTEASACENPKLNWRDRLDRLDELLVDARKKLPSCYAALVDADALAEEGPTDDDDLNTTRMRRDLFLILRREIERGGWIVLRPSPAQSLSESLDMGAVEVEENGTGSSGTNFLRPDARPLANWLLKTGRLDDHDLAEIQESVSRPSDYLAHLVYDTLGDESRRVARRVQALRRPTTSNGSFGPLPWATASSSDDQEASIKKDAVTQLREVGFLYAGDPRADRDLEMSRPVRRMLQLQASALEQNSQESFHRWLALKFEGSSKHLHGIGDVGGIIEAHHHAACSRDIELAKRTARYHALDLRALATSLSRDHADYQGAASLFDFALERFDPDDAYCWEYLGYNLARWDASENHSGRNATRILEAYSRAYQLARSNPLYHGRWLGYRAEQGEDIGREFHGGMAQYVREEWSDSDTLSRFALAALDGVARGHGLNQARLLAERWKKVFEERAPRVILRYGRG